MKGYLPLALAGLLFLGAGCFATTNPAQVIDPPVETPVVEESKPVTAQNVYLIDGSMLRLSVFSELTTEITSLEDQTISAVISNLLEDASEEDGLGANEFIIEVAFNAVNQSVTVEDFETMYTTINQDVFKERQVMKGMTKPDEGMTSFRVGYFRASEDGDAVAINMLVGSEAGLQNALVAIEQLEWLK